jgi:hypothetical protein
VRTLTLQQLKQDAEKTRKPMPPKHRKFPKKTHAEKKRPRTLLPIPRSEKEAWNVIMDNYPLVLKAIHTRELNLRSNAGPDLCL